MTDCPNSNYHGGCHYPVCASPDHYGKTCETGRLRATWEHCQMDEERVNDRKTLGLAPGARSLPPFLREYWFKLPLRLRQRFWRETGHFKVSPSYSLIVDMHIAALTQEGFSRAEADADRKDAGQAPRGTQGLPQTEARGGD